MSQSTTTYENHLHPETPKWFAIYTRSKSEKVVQDMLTSKQIECYLPMQTVTRRYTRKIKTYEVPLIRCYLFVRIVKKQYIPTLETQHVVKFVRIAKNLIAIPDHEIDLLKRIAGEGDEVEADIGRFHQGDEVEVIGGKLTGLRGKLVDLQGKKQMVVELYSVGVSLKMNIDISLLRKVV